MNDFIAKLVALRNGAGNLVKGTLENMGNVREREQQMLDAERERNTEMIRNAFGTEQNYLDLQNATSTPALPETPGEKLGNFIERLIQLRGGAKN